MQPVIPDKKEFIALTTIKMPYGKYKGFRFVDLPDPYLVWFSQKGFPEGKLGQILQSRAKIQQAVFSRQPGKWSWGQKKKNLLG
ncbi:DUF3820 family protein [Desulfobacula sp.]|uniref:DUF3820 family protein n=1 Tax=Desulfobacula sp. TaxID=2593537 RepID=UPI00260FD059|nr:DUF3820 family protein [Desulfobacula sp.]